MERVASPLAEPRGVSGTLRRFLERISLPAQAPAAERLEAVAAAFSRLPYENLTKIIKEAAVGGGERARRAPEEVLADHLALGTGGTCFSLTAALLHIVRALGWRAEPLLADRHYGPDTHCALAVWLDGRPHLLDPGFLILRPVPLDGSRIVELETPFNDVFLVPQVGTERLELHTIQRGNQTHRLTFRTAPADPGAFLRAWDASFGWDMMRYPVITRVGERGQVYLQGRRLQLRDRSSVSTSTIGGAELPASIAGEFGIDPGVTRRALTILGRRGGLGGTP